MKEIIEQIEKESAAHKFAMAGDVAYVVILLLLLATTGDTDWLLVLVAMAICISKDFQVRKYLDIMWHMAMALDEIDSEDGEDEE